jgi:DNA-binding SARP family transcriptional activator
MDVRRAAGSFVVRRSLRALGSCGQHHGVAPVEVDLLGPLELRVSGRAVPVPGPKQRALLAMLALHGRQVVSVGSLVDVVWGDPAPDRAEHTLQQHVSALRKLLDAAREPGVSPVLITRSPGYMLLVDAGDVDEFERSAAAGNDAAAAGRWPEALTAFDAALARWKGSALADTRDSAKLNAAAVRLDEQRIATMEARFDARLECGQAREAVPEIERLAEEFPLRERLTGQLMLALYRSGRQADALAAYQSARDALIENLGIEPGVALRALEQSILRQEPELDVGSGTAQREVHATFRVDSPAKVGRVVLPDGQSVLLATAVTVLGRDPAAEIHLVDSRVSRRHAQIDNVGGRSVLRDLGSTNGTTVNGEPADDHVLTDGDVVSLGGVELRFREADA